MKLYRKFLLLSRGRQIAVVVCLLHLLAIFGLVIHHFASRQLKPPRPMLVRTHKAIAEPKMRYAKEEAPKLQTVAPKPQKVHAEGKSVEQKPKGSATKKMASAKSKPTVAKKAPGNHLLKEIAESLDMLNSEAKPSPRPSLTLPSKIEPKAQIAPESNVDPTYSEFLVSYLQSALDLPEYGEVRAKIEIDRFGRLIDCEILEAKSVKNAEFLKNQLPELTFPCLNDFGIVDATETFTITFRNVEIH